MKKHFTRNSNFRLDSCVQIINKATDTGGCLLLSLTLWHSGATLSQRHLWVWPCMIYLLPTHTHTQAHTRTHTRTYTVTHSRCFLLIAVQHFYLRDLRVCRNHSTVNSQDPCWPNPYWQKSQLYIILSNFSLEIIVRGIYFMYTAGCYSFIDFLRTLWSFQASLQSLKDHLGHSLLEQ